MGLPQIDTYETVVEISDMLPNDVSLWPAEMQDQLAAEIEKVNITRRLIEGKGRLVLAHVNVLENEGRWFVTLLLQPAIYVEAWQGPPPEPDAKVH